MHKIIKGQRRAIITELERRIQLAQLDRQVVIRKDEILTTEFYIEVDTDVLAVDVRHILKLACKERNWDILGGLIEGDISRKRVKPQDKPPVVGEIIAPPNQDIAAKIVAILSNHRSSIDQSKPLTLTKRQILSLLESSLNPDYPLKKLLKELEASLRELEAKGEIYGGVGNRFCIAHPMILYEEALFIGDRAYLSIAYKILGNSVRETNQLIFPDLDFEVIQQKLIERGISLIRIEQSLQYLPEPHRPPTQMLQGYAVEDPFVNPDYVGILHYVPQWGEQGDRWREPSRSKIRNPDLLKLPTGEYLWYEQGVFYQLEKDAAILAMFQLDREVGQPINVVWDRDRGILDLRHLTLPRAYAQRIWRLSSHEAEENRVRYFQPIYRGQVVQIFQRLECKLL